jgi:hypothetical protein
MHTAIMSQVYYFCAFALQNPTHNINGSIMPIKKRSGCNYSDFRMLAIHVQTIVNKNKIIRGALRYFNLYKTLCKYSF